MLESLPNDLLSVVVARVPASDLFCVALACKALYVLCKILRPDGFKTFITRSLPRMLWAIRLNASPTKKWYVYAAFHGQVAVMDWMYRKGVYPDDFDGTDSPMHCAAEHGHLDVMKWLCDHMVPITQMSPAPYDWAPMHVAANFGHCHILKWLASKGLSLTTPASRRIAQQPIDFAAVNGHLPVVRYLVEQGVSPDLLQSGISFHSMALRGHLETMMYLHERGTRIPNMPMFEALQMPLSSLAEADVRKLMHPIHFAATTKDLPMLMFLYEKCGADLDTMCVSGLQPVHYVLFMSYRYLPNDHLDHHKVGSLDAAEVIPCLQFLADNGVSLTSPDNHGRQPMHFAGLANNFELVKWLHEHGVPLDVADNEGNQLCHNWRKDDHRILEMLFNKGIPLTTPDNSGMVLMDNVAASVEAQMDNIQDQVPVEIAKDATYKDLVYLHETFGLPYTPYAIYVMESHQLSKVMYFVHNRLLKKAKYSSMALLFSDFDGTFANNLPHCCDNTHFSAKETVARLLTESLFVDSDNDSEPDDEEEDSEDSGEDGGEGDGEQDEDADPDHEPNF